MAGVYCHTAVHVDAQNTFSSPAFIMVIISLKPSKTDVLQASLPPKPPPTTWKPVLQPASLPPKPPPSAWEPDDPPVTFLSKAPPSTKKRCQPPVELTPAAPKRPRNMKIEPMSPVGVYPAKSPSLQAPRQNIFGRDTTVPRFDVGEEE